MKFTIHHDQQENVDASMNMAASKEGQRLRIK
jgi:hypothetical protein